MALAGAEPREPRARGRRRREQAGGNGDAMMRQRGDQAEPTLASHTRAGWASWVERLVHAGQQQLAAFGAALVVGFLSGAAAIYAFAALAEDVLQQQTQQLDLGVLAWLRQFSSPRLDTLARVVSLFGSELVALFLVVLLVAFTRQRRWGAAVALLLVAGGAQLLNAVLKELFQRTRPVPVSTLIPAQGFSFPSGHAMVAAAFYLFLAYLTWRLVRGWWRVGVTCGLLALILLVGLARLYLGVHYASDVVAGYVAGFVWTDAVILGGRLLAVRRRPVRVVAGRAG